MLKLVTPHLRADFLNARAFERFDNERKFLITAVSRGIAVINAEREIIFIYEIAERLLQTYFSDCVASNLPEALQRDIKSHATSRDKTEYYAPAEPYTAKREHSELMIVRGG